MPGRPIRVAFERRGDARFLSHLDFLRLVERAVRRSGLDVDYSEGFNPRIRISLPVALPVGVASVGDCFAIRVNPEVSLPEAQRRLEQAFPDGIRVLGVTEGAAPKPSAAAWLSLVIEDGEAAARAVVEALDASEDARFARAFARGGVLYVHVSSPGEEQRPPRIRQCVERVAELLVASGFTGGVGEITRYCGASAAEFDARLERRDT